MVFIFFAFSFLLHLLLLPITGVLIVKFKTSLRPLTEFAWLIAFPIIVILYAIFAGLLCECWCHCAYVSSWWMMCTLTSCGRFFHGYEAMRGGGLCMRLGKNYYRGDGA